MGKKPYVLTQGQVVDVMMDTANRAVHGSRATHPADIANAITCAVENTAEAFDVLCSYGILDWER